MGKSGLQIRSGEHVSLKSDSVSNEKLKRVTGKTIRGRNDSNEGVVEDLSVTEVKQMLGLLSNVFEIKPADWVFDGVDEYYYDIYHGFDTKYIVPSCINLDTNEVYEPVGYSFDVNSPFNEIRVKSSARSDLQIFLNNNGILLEEGNKMYKNVLKAANQDYLSFSSEQSVTDTFTFTFYVESTTVNKIILANSTNSNYVRILNDRIFIQCDGGNMYLPVGSLIEGENSVTIRRSGTAVYASSNGGTELLRTDNPFKFQYFGFNGTTYVDTDIINFSLNGVDYDLNEVSGATFYGSDASQGTRNTSSVDPDYIDTQMIVRIA